MAEMGQCRRNRELGEGQEPDMCRMRVDCPDDREPDQEAPIPVAAADWVGRALEATPANCN